MPESCQNVLTVSFIQILIDRYHAPLDTVGPCLSPLTTPTLSGDPYPKPHAGVPECYLCLQP